MRFRRRYAKPLALAVAICYAMPTLANPVNPTVVRGTASFAQSGGALTVRNSANAIINWQGFSIGRGELTKFVQPSAASAVLNRVTGQDPSQILGQLQSNGKVLLINPNGILFGRDARVDVAGLIASTLNLSSDDFLAGRYRFAGDGANGVVNRGTIATPMGGSVYLVGGSVRNEGLITSPKGEVILAAGQSVSLVDTATPNVKVEISAPAGEAVNLGSILAGGGGIDIHAATVNQQGIVNADALVRDDQGRIRVIASGNMTLGAASVTSAANHAGGDGGFIETSGAHVQIEDGAKISTAAPQGKAGTWLIDPVDITITSGAGGSLGGGASQTYAPGIQPSSITDGTINATLNGGTNVVIQTSGGTGGNGDITVNGTAAILNSSGGARALTLMADRNIVMSPGASISGNSGNSLAVTFHSDADNNGVGNIQMLTGSSIATFGGDVVMGGGVNPLTGRAAGSGSAWPSSSGIYIDGNIAAGAGNVSLRGKGAVGFVNGDGVAFAGGTLSSNGTVTIDGLAQAWHANGGCVGVCDFVAGVNFANPGVRLTTATGTVNVTGVNTTAGTRAQGITVNGATVETIGAGTLTFNGTSTPLPDTNWGVGILFGGTVRTTVVGGGAVIITGTASPVDGGVVLLDGNLTSGGGELRMLSPAGSIALAGASTVGGAGSGNVLVKLTDSSPFDVVNTTILNTGSSALSVSLAGGSANDNGVPITAGALRLLGSGTFNLGGIGNTFGTLASSSTGAVTVRSSGGLAIGSVTSYDGSASTTTSGILTNGNVNVTAVGPIFNTGTTIVGPGNTLFLTGPGFANSSTGILRGLGTLNLAGVSGTTLVNLGNIFPGTTLTSGTLTVQGNVVFGSTGGLDARLAGVSSFDKLAVTGSALLDGTLNAALTGGYVPNGESFQALTYAGGSGQFAAHNLPAAFVQTYNATNLTLAHSLALQAALALAQAAPSTPQVPPEVVRLPDFLVQPLNSGERRASITTGNPLAKIDPDGVATGLRVADDPVLDILLTCTP